jgi:hypothetical protein
MVLSGSEAEQDRAGGVVVLTQISSWSPGLSSFAEMKHERMKIV